MNKIISVTIGGILFQIDEQAYENLDNYLRSVKQHFRNTPGNSEIVADIEARIAEMLLGLLKDARTYVTVEDVQQIINRMGRPEDFDTYEEQSGEPAGESSRNYSKGSSYRRIFRNDDNRVIGGVCSGIAAYFDLDPLWLRLAFAISFFMFGSGLLLYVILWAIIPKARTISDRLEMRGEPVNISNIKKNIKEEIDGLEERFEGYQEEFRRSDVVGRVRRSVSNTMPEIKGALRQILYVLTRVFGVVMVLLGVFLLMLLILGYTGFFEDLIHVPFRGIFPFLFSEPYMNNLFIVALTVAVLVPLILIILQGFLMLFDIKVFPREIKRGLKILWTVSLIVSAVMIGLLLSHFSASGSSRNKLSIDTAPEKILMVEIEGFYEDDPDSDADHIRFFGRHSGGYTDSNGLYLENVRLDIVPAKGNQAELITLVNARGNNYTEAIRNSEGVGYNIKVDDSLIRLKRSSFLRSGLSWRNQEVRLLLKLPAGRKVFLGKGLGSMLFDVDNEDEIFDQNMEGHLWEMRESGLKCLDCKEMKNETFRNQKAFHFTDFTEIESRGNIKMIINQGSEFKVSVAGEQDKTDMLDFEMSGKRLLIKSSHKWLTLESNDEAPLVIITLPHLDFLKMRDRTDVQLNGISGHELVIEAAGFCEMKAELEVEQLNIEMAGAGKIQLKGHAQEMKVEIAGAGEINAGSFETVKTDIELTGAARAKVNASQLIVAELHGASTLTYKGNARVKSTATGASVIEKE